MIKHFLSNRKEKSTTLEQQKLLDYVHDEKNIEKAAVGSMEKRLELIKRVELKKRTVQNRKDHPCMQYPEDLPVLVKEA